MKLRNKKTGEIVDLSDSGKGITIFANYPSGAKAYLDLLFGGEE